MDFSLSKYREFLETLIESGYHFLPISEIDNSLHKRIVCLRQDVDALPLNSLIFAKMQAEIGIKSTFYFRIIPESFDLEIIDKVAKMGHEIGYHYEDLSFVSSNLKMDRRSNRKWSFDLEYELMERGINSFLKNLETFRNFVHVNTICMHGSPLCKWDSRLLWKYFDYHDYDIILEPYFDINFEEVLYLTDTGRKWDGASVSIRDRPLTLASTEVKGVEKNLDNYHEWKVKPVSGSLLNMSHRAKLMQSQYKIHSTNDIIRLSNNGELAQKIVMTFHPQRWNGNAIRWIRELIFQNSKNIVKYFLIKKNIRIR